MYIENYEEVKEFFSDTPDDVVVFKMSSVRGGIVIRKPDDTTFLTEDNRFRIGPYVFYLHEQTDRYVVGSFAIF